MVGRDLEEGKRDAHQNKVADECQRILSLKLIRVSDHQEISKDGPFIFKNSSDIGHQRIDIINIRLQWDVIYRLLPFVIPCVPIGALNQELFDTF